MVARQADVVQPMSLSSTELRPANVIMGPRHTAYWMAVSVVACCCMKNNVITVQMVKIYRLVMYVFACFVKDE